MPRHWTKYDSALHTSPPPQEPPPLTPSILRPQFTHPLTDMSPFFQKQYVKGHSGDIFTAYGRLLAEIVLVLPCQVGGGGRISYAEFSLFL